MKCPKCGFEQPVTLECVRCGIVFSKFARTQQQILDDLSDQGMELTETRPLDISETPSTVTHGAMPELAEPVPGPLGTNGLMAPPPRSTKPGGSTATLAGEFNPLDQPIRPALRYLRLVSGLLAISFGSLLFWAGAGVAPEPMEAMLLIVYLCVGAFWVLSFGLKTVTVRRFSIEMLIFIFATLALRLSSPHLFDTGKITQSLATPAGGGQIQTTQPAPEAAAPVDLDAN